VLAADDASEMPAGAASITMIADRESDIYEQFAHCPKDVQLLTRAGHDQCLAEAGRLAPVGPQDGMTLAHTRAAIVF